MRYSTAGAGQHLFEVHLISKLPRGRILNVGAGDGVSVDGWAVVNVDHVPPSGMSTGSFVVSDATELPFAAAAFDGALLKDVIEHVPDPIRALREVGRVVKAGGQVIVETPRAIPRAVWADPTHIRGFTACSLETAARMAGLVVAERPKRIGGLPGAGRFHLVGHLETLMRLPVLGHWYGTNWLMTITVPA